MCGLFTQDNIPVFITGEFVEQVLFGEFPAISFFRSEIFRDGESRHDRTVVDGVEFHLVGYLQRVAEGFRNIRKEGIHLSRRLHPFLFGITHTVRVVQVFTRTEADQAVMCFRVFCVDKVNVIGRDYLDIVFTRQFQNRLVGCYLVRVYILCGVRIMCFMPLYFQVVIFSEQVLEPKNRFFGLVHPSVQDMLWNFPTDTGGAYDQVFVIFFQQLLVDTRTSVKTFRPGQRNHLDQILVAV